MPPPTPPTPPTIDDALVRRLPLPLAGLYRGAANAKSAEDLYAAAWLTWEACLKTLGAVAVGTFATDPDPRLAEHVQHLARPSLGHWVGLLRALVPVLAGRKHAGFLALHEQVYKRRRDDLGRAAGLSAVLAELRGRPPAARATVSLAELFDDLVTFRNQEFGHGAGRQRSAKVLDRVGRALLAGFADVFAVIDPLVGGRLFYLDKVRRDGLGWKVGGLELAGTGPARVAEEPWPAGPDPAGERVYLREAAEVFLPLHPLVWYDADDERFYFLNGVQGQKRVEYLCYDTGDHVNRDGVADDHTAFLSRALGLPVAAGQVAEWADQALAAEPVAEPAESAVIRRLGEYEVEGELGRGGMGIVYRARQPSLDRIVAVKRLFRPGDPRAEKRFAREIRALGQVQHPHLVKVYASGSDGDQWFYVMELVEGAPLSAISQRLTDGSATPASVDWAAWRAAVSTVCDAGRSADTIPELPVLADPPAPADTPPAPSPGSLGYIRQVVELVAQVADAAHALHEAGILHRDVKPGNVMVSPDGERATLMDLGLAKFLNAPDDGATKTRGFVGTARYASPEQVAALGGVDRRADVYGLGATLWELLTLRAIHGADKLTEQQLMQRIMRTPAETVRKYHPGVPRELEAVVGRCLERNPDDRYPTAKALADDLRNWLGGKKTKRRARHLGRRAKRVALVGVLMGLAVVAVVVALGQPQSQEVRMSTSEVSGDPSNVFVKARVVTEPTGLKVQPPRFKNFEYTLADKNRPPLVVNLDGPSDDPLLVWFTASSRSRPPNDIVLTFSTGETYRISEWKGQEHDWRTDTFRCKEDLNRSVTVRFPNPDPQAAATTHDLTLLWRPNPYEMHLHALSIGVSKCPKSGLPELKASNNDAEELWKAFTRLEGLLFSEVQAGKALPDATRNQILIELWNFRRRVRTDFAKLKLAVVTFSGHGTIDNGGFVFLPGDYSGDLNIGIRVDDLTRNLGDLECPTLLLLDSSRSGQAILDISRGNARPGLFVLAAADAKGLAFDDGQHGAMSWAILEVLTSKAVKPIGPDGLVTLADLYEYVQEVVPKRVKGQNPMQEQVIVPFIPLGGRPDAIPIAYFPPATKEKAAPPDRNGEVKPAEPALAPAKKEKAALVLDSPYVPTPQSVVKEMLKLAGVTSGDVVYDLGSGDGRIVITAVKEYKAKKGVGVDIDPERIAESNTAAKVAGVEDQVEFRQADMLKLDSVADATVVTLYLLPEVNQRLQPMLRKTLKPGARVVSHDFLMKDDWRPDKEVSVKDATGQEHTLYLWTIKDK